jgi:hypothetical protein
VSIVFAFRMSEEARSRPTISFSQWGRVRLRRFLVNATGLIVLDACGSLRSCRRPLHPFPVVAVFRSAVDAHLIIGAIRQLHRPGESVGAAKKQFTYCLLSAFLGPLGNDKRHAPLHAPGCSFRTHGRTRNRLHHTFWPVLQPAQPVQRNQMETCFLPWSTTLLLRARPSDW